jgi:hypothetical protein
MTFVCTEQETELPNLTCQFYRTRPLANYNTVSLSSYIRKTPSVSVIESVPVFGLNGVKAPTDLCLKKSMGPNVMLGGFTEFFKHTRVLLKDRHK